MWPKQLVRLASDQRSAALVRIWACLPRTVTGGTAADDDSLVGTIILTVDCRLKK